MSEPFDSYAQNGEDVVLWRALGDVDGGRYVDIGANDPVRDSVTWAFYRHGWRGIAAEPVPELAERFRQARPDDLLVQAAITDKSSDAVLLHQVADSGLSTLNPDYSARHAGDGWLVSEIEVPARTLDDVLTDAGWDGLDTHFMVVDTEGSEAAVLAGIDLHNWRPWVIVVEATGPATAVPSHHCWEPTLLRTGYRFTMFDGLSRFYVADEHAERLAGRLSAPASVLDTYTTEAQRSRQAALVAGRGNPARPKRRDRPVAW